MERRLANRLAVVMGSHSSWRDSGPQTIRAPGRGGEGTLAEKTNMLRIPSYSDLGVDLEPNVERVEGLQYNSAAQTLIITIFRAPFGAPQRRIFVRGIEEARYREIVPPDRRHFNETVTCHGAAFAFSRCSDHADEIYTAICAIHLPRGSLSETPSPSPRNDKPQLRMTISRLLSASFDGSEIYVIMAYMPPFVAGSTSSVYCEYKIERMSTKTGEHEVIAVLPTPYA
jgi:hypothetical protein